MLRERSSFSMPRRLLVVWVLMLFGLVAAPPVSAFAEEGKPRLVVLVVFDQLRGDYLQRWHDHFGEGGFRRLEQEGAWFQNCHYPYAVTKTAPGHASLLTGCTPSTHGIITNEWYDRRTGKYTYCVSSERHDAVPPSSDKATDEKRLDESRGISPDKLLALTVGDALKKAMGDKSRVVSLSFKDRSAVLLGGHHPDACYWFNTATGQFGTSTYYRERLHPWVEEFNRSRFAQSWQGADWEPLHPKLDYQKLSGGKLIADNGDKKFSRPLPAARDGKPAPAYYKTLYATPFGNEAILELTKRAIAAEDLGKHEQPDLLAVSFSCNDPIGHIWGPDSPEVLDVTLRADRILRELLGYLDTRVGKGRYLLALSADHGICPLPEESRARGLAALRVTPSILGADAEEFLRSTFDKGGERGRWIEARAEPWIYLNQALIKERALEPATVELALARWLQQQPGILTAYTRTQILRGVPDDDAIGQKLRRSFYAERSGDVAAILKPFHLFSPPLGLGTTHGTPHAYDTHVPLLVMGPGVRPAVYDEKVTPQAIAPIFARALGISMPNDIYGRIPDSLK